MKKRLFIYIAFFGSLLLMACQETDELENTSSGSTAASEDIIHVGGIATDELIATAHVTRTEVDEETVSKTDAENISWLVEPLETGLDITYGLSSNRSGTSRVAILKLLTEGGNIKYSVDGDNKYAEYSFLYRDNTTGEATQEPAIWHGNGAHFFEGLYVPDQIKYDASADPAQTIEDVSAQNLTSDQHDDGTTSGSLGNYTLLSRYLGMPSNYTLNATVARIKLPFRHRLARVLAYILIDPEMGSDVKIEGYKSTEAETTAGKDDPTTSKIRFCNVKVLAGVKDSYTESTQHHTYTPQWIEIRKAIPHFVGERGSYNDRTNKVVNAESFIAYYDVNEKTYTYPDDSDWSTLNGYTYNETTKLSSDGKYKKVSFGLVPVYDMIVRPTYTSLNNVMYDEEGVSNSQTKQNLYAATNQIDFDITLSNGLQYSKRFTFDLNANYQTVVYLHISKERVDYNSSGSELWVEKRGDDDYYGVNNQNGNTLSIAGSSWQRAYTNSETNYNVTDGHQYLHDSEDEFAQYVTNAKWIEMIREACEGGKHHGDYFILKNDISIPAAAFPENFVFTGHLDGQDHTITLTDAEYTPAHDKYETWTSGGGTRYVKESENSYVEFTPDANKIYCDANTSTHNVITDFSTYSGSVAYIRTENYGLVEVASLSGEGTYYSNASSTYTQITALDDYISEKQIYQKNENYNSVAVDNLVSTGTTYYKYEGGQYVAIDNISTYFGTIYKLENDTYNSVAVDDLVSTGTYYYHNGTNYVQISDINSYKIVYTKGEDTYTQITSLSDLKSAGAYYDSSHNAISDIKTYLGIYAMTYSYSDAINFYKFVHYEPVIGSSTGTPTDGYMFSGLNGKYSTAQETDATATWEANVHKEKGNSKTYWVPYKNETDGWRAEVMNVKVSGGKLFKDGATITGYVHNCWEGSTAITNYTPTIPEY